MVSSLPQYRNENFRNEPAQIAHREWVLKQLEATMNRDGRIAAAVFEARVIPEALVAKKFGAARLESAKSSIFVAGIAPAELLSDSLRFAPSCFGLPRAIKPIEPSCSMCPLLTTCAKLEQGIRNLIIKRMNKPSGDWTLERRRKQQRERTARHRAKQRAAREMPSQLVSQLRF
jgi:hypothetical protein